MGSKPLKAGVQPHPDPPHHAPAIPMGHRLCYRDRGEVHPRLHTHLQRNPRSRLFHSKNESADEATSATSSGAMSRASDLDDWLHAEAEILWADGDARVDEASEEVLSGERRSRRQA